MSAGQTRPTDLAARRPGSAGVLAAAAMIGSAVCWGSATVMSKESLAHLPPFTLLVVQLIASVGFLWTAVAVGRTPVRLDAAARQAASCGVLEPGLAYAIGTSALALTGAAHASLISATEPLLVVLVAWLLFRDAPGLRTLAAIGAAVAGVALVPGPRPDALSLAAIGARRARCIQPGRADGTAYLPAQAGSRSKTSGAHIIGTVGSDDP